MTHKEYNHEQYLHHMYPNAPFNIHSATEVLAGYTGVDIYWLQTYTTSLILGAHRGWYA